ncbi:response regulator transcription factor [Alteromonadaceae bacterium BrNp21-10]|nr:response regulator transcription factor [Alteromonadaceae bacterium BrNp21-10]
MNLNKQHILIIEDEPKIADLIGKYLTIEGYRFTHSNNGSDGLAQCQQQSPDLVILDIMLPDMDGIQVCENLRQFSDVPVIMLTARVDEIDHLLGFRVGADDYVCKPFRPRELIARVQAVLHRSGQRKGPHNVDKQEKLQVGSITMDIRQHQVQMHGVEVKLTLNEFNLLKAFLSHPNQVFSREDLLNITQRKYTESYERTIDSHIKNLRKKLQNSDANFNAIESIYGVGYRYQLR